MKCFIFLGILTVLSFHVEQVTELVGHYIYIFSFLFSGRLFSERKGTVLGSRDGKSNQINHGLEVAHPLSGSSFSRLVRDRIGIWKCWFLKRGENRSSRRKTSRNKGENQQQTQPTYRLEPRLRCWEASALTIAPPLFAKKKCNRRREIRPRIASTEKETRVVERK